MANVDGRIWGAYNPGAASSPIKKARETGSNLDKDAFLQLLITQMKYQDPLNPVEDKEFLAQMAQFTALEQMQNLNATAENQKAYSMIGKEIYANFYNESVNRYEEVEGRVDSVVTVNGKSYVVVDKKEVPVGSVSEVYENIDQAKLLNAINTNLFYSQNMNLIGKTVQAMIFNEDGDPVKFIEGKVEFVKMASGVPMLVIGNDEVFPQEVISVANEKMLIGKQIYFPAGTGEGVGLAFGDVDSVTIRDKKAYLVVNGKEFQIDKIDAASEAIRHVGENLTLGEVSGRIDFVVLREGKVYYSVGGKEVLFDDTIKK